MILAQPMPSTNSASVKLVNGSLSVESIGYHPKLGGKNLGSFDVFQFPTVGTLRVTHRTGERKWLNEHTLKKQQIDSFA